MRFHKFARSIGITTLVIAVLPALIAGLLIAYMYISDGILTLRGYHLGETGKSLGEKLVQENLPVTECEKYRNGTFALFTPSEGDHIATCIRTYAELRKDPSACELLMPSSYGLSCVGAAETEADNCMMNNEYVRSDDGDVSYTDCRADDARRTRLQNQCCLIARVSFVKSENDCSSLSGYPTLYEECLQSLAFKNGDPTKCNEIENLNRKAACLVNAQAIQDDPSICKGCKPRVQTLNRFQ